MPITYEAIATVTVGAGGASSIDFTSIPGTYTDLLLYHSLRINEAAIVADTNIQFNGDTGNNYNFLRLNASGAATSSDKATGNALYGLSGLGTANNATASTFGSCLVYIPNYTSSTQKSFSYDSVTENNATTANSALGAILWTGTAAITSIKLRAYSGQNLLQYSTATLYGIKNS